MIIKNISPYPVKLPGLGNVTLMPGEESDLSSFTQKQKDDCIELQDGFRRGELICTGMGHPNNQDVDSRLRIARARILQNGQPQPLVEVQRGRRPSASILDEVTNPTIQDEMMDETPTFSSPKPPPIVQRRPMPKIFQEPTGIMEKDAQGNVVSRAVVSRERVEPAIVAPKISKDGSDTPRITPERIKEIWAQRCISYRTNGQKCKRWATKGSEYCEQHMPAEEKEQRKKSKKQDFFKE